MLEKKNVVNAGFIALLRQKPDAKGSYKRAYFRENEKTGEEIVLLFEIGPESFFQMRSALFRKLSKYAQSRNAIVPEMVFHTRLEDPDDGKVYYYTLTRSRRCREDLQQYLSRKREIDIIDLTSMFVDLYAVLVRFLDDGLFFTDVKAENVIHCGDHLAFIDLDSVLSLAEILQGQTGTFTLPEGQEFARFRKILVKPLAQYPKRAGDARYKMDLFWLYNFYTLFAFSSMVFRFYVYITKGRFNTLFMDPFDLLPEEDDLMKDLKDRFPRHVAGHTSMQRLLLLAWETLSFVYFEDSPTREMVLEVTNLWKDSMQQVLAKEKRKESISRKRKEKLNNIHLGESKLLL